MKFNFKTNGVEPCSIWLASTYIILWVFKDK